MNPIVAVSTLDELNELKRHGLAKQSEVVSFDGMMRPSAVSQYESLIELVTGKPINKEVFEYGQKATVCMNLAVSYSQPAAAMLEGWLRLRNIDGGDQCAIS